MSGCTREESECLGHLANCPAQTARVLSRGESVFVHMIIRFRGGVIVGGIDVQVVLPFRCRPTDPGCPL